MDNRLPEGAQALVDHHQEVWQAYERLGEACAESGPLDARTRRLVKLALAIGAHSEGAVHSHTRRALGEGIAPADLEHVAILAIPTLGLPRGVAALTWIRDLAGNRQR
jgi:alkylhydroperoxidase/carboxymuconolactone decarboxylase family protein YurZ